MADETLSPGDAPANPPRASSAADPAVAAFDRYREIADRPVNDCNRLDVVRWEQDLVAARALLIDAKPATPAGVIAKLSAAIEFAGGCSPDSETMIRQAIEALDGGTIEAGNA